MQVEKKVKLSNGSAKPSELEVSTRAFQLVQGMITEERLEVADMFLKASAPTSSLNITHAESRSELRSSLAAHPKRLSLLETELDTLGEDWLLALQDELTKSYFQSVRYDTQ